MQEEVRNCGCGCGNNNSGCSFLGNLFGGNGCGCGDNNSILFFILIFLLLFTNCGCNR